MKERLKQEVDRLADRYWQQWADGMLSCPVCGATVHPMFRDQHRSWHPFAERYVFKNKV